MPISSLDAAFATLAKELAAMHVLLPDSKQVESYLVLHPGLGSIVPAICKQARQELGPEVELSLEAYTDPEIDDRYLTLYVRQAKYGPDSMSRIEHVSRQFDDALDKAPGYFLITTDFRRPRGSNGVRLERPR
jgi:hypothetical protein